MADHIALYLPEAPPSIEWIKSQSGVKSCEVILDKNGIHSQYRVQFIGQSIIINVMVSTELSQHIFGFSNYVMQLHKKKPVEQIVSILEKVAKTKTVLGCVIEPGLDEQGFVGGLLTSIVCQQDGLMFTHDSVFDSDGHPVMGPFTSRLF